jgi:hypothetical protein
MLTLEELLKEREQRLGKDHPAVQMLRDQINAEKQGKTFQELYQTSAAPEQAGRSEPDYVLDLLEQFNLPVTRENYLELAYPEGVPEDLDETTLPERIRIRITRTQATLALFRELSTVMPPVDPSEPPDGQYQQVPRQ